MVEKQEYVPTLTEWDELVLLWNRSKTIFASTLTTGLKARMAWVTKTFVDAHDGATHSAVYAWLQSNLDIAAGSSPACDARPVAIEQDEPTVVHRIRSTHVKTPIGTHSDPSTATRVVAYGPRVHR